MISRSSILTKNITRGILHNPLRLYSTDMHVPRCKLHFIDHPVHGQVYPVVTYDFSKTWFTVPFTAAYAHTGFNLTILYSAFINPIYAPALAGFLINPMFLIPSIIINYRMLMRHNIVLYGGRSQV